MSIHLTPQQIARYHQRQSSPAEARQVEEHAARCKECGRHLEVEAELQATFAALWAEFRPALRGVLRHLSYEQLAAVVDGTLAESERTGIAEHLHHCPRCAAEVDDLRAFKATLPSHCLPFSPGP